MFKVLIRTGLCKRGKENLVVRKDLDSHIQANEAFIEGLLLLHFLYGSVVEPNFFLHQYTAHIIL